MQEHQISRSGQLTTYYINGNNHQEMNKEFLAWLPPWSCQRAHKKATNGSRVKISPEYTHTQCSFVMVSSSIEQAWTKHDLHKLKPDSSSDLHLHNLVLNENEIFS